MKRLFHLTFLLTTFLVCIAANAIAQDVQTIDDVQKSLNYAELRTSYATMPDYNSDVDSEGLMDTKDMTYATIKAIIKEDAITVYGLDEEYDTPQKQQDFLKSPKGWAIRWKFAFLCNELLNQEFFYKIESAVGIKSNPLSVHIIEPNPAFFVVETTDAHVIEDKDFYNFKTFTPTTLSASTLEKAKACQKIEAYLTVRLADKLTEDGMIIILPQKIYFVNEADDEIIYAYTFQQSAGGSETTSTDDTIYDNLSADEQPQYSGGNMAILQFITQNLKYPVTAMEQGVQGRVVVEFVVEKDGSMSNVKVVRSVDSDLDKEAVRVIKGLSKFTPGTKNGQPVRARYMLPITFRMD